MQLQTKSSNPVLRNTLDNTYVDAYQYDNKQYGFLTRKNVVGATLFLLIIVSLTAYGVIKIGKENPGIALSLNLIGVFGAIIMGLIISFNRKAQRGSAILSIIFSIFEGLMVGGFTYSIGTNLNIQGSNGVNIVLQAIIGTISLFFVAMLLYGSKIIDVNKKFTSFVMYASMGFGAMYLVNFVISLVTGTNLLFSSGPIPIIIGVLAIILGCLSLLVDLKNVDVATKAGVPSQFKWTLAVGFMTSIVWIYMEILRVLYLTLTRQ